jgi:hypothetical protein
LYVQRATLNSVALWVAVWAAACGGDDDGADFDAAVPGPDAAPTFDAPPKIDAGPDFDAALPPLGSTCADPFAIDTFPATHTADTTGFPGGLRGTCSPGSASAPDAVYQLTLGATPVDVLATVTVDEKVAAPFDVVLAGRTSCSMVNTEVACSDAGWGERIELLDVADDVFLIVDGTTQFGGANAGAYQVDIGARVIVGDGATCDPTAMNTRCAAGFRCVSGTCVADSAALGCTEAVDLTPGLTAVPGDPVTVTDTTHAFEADYYAGSCAAVREAGFGERLYRIDVAATSSLDASTDDAATDFDTVLYLVADTCDGAEVACHDDVDVEMFNLRSHLVVPSLDPGTYYLIVDGSSPSPGTGSYQLAVSLTPL